MEGGRRLGGEEESGRLGRRAIPGKCGAEVRAGPGPGGGAWGSRTARRRKGFPGRRAGASRVGSGGDGWAGAEEKGTRERGKKRKRCLEFPLRDLKRSVSFLLLPAVQWLGRVHCAGSEVQADQPELQ